MKNLGYPLTFALLALAVAMPTSRAEAQRAGSRAIYVAVLEHFPDVDARAVVVRDEVRDIVVLRAEEATVEALAMALSILRFGRLQPPLRGHGQLIPIAGFALAGELDSAARERYEVTLARLERRPVNRVGSFGPGRWIRYGPS